jgi:hypothetical protein
VIPAKGGDALYMILVVLTVVETSMLVFSLEDGGSMFLRNIVFYLQVKTALHLRRPTSTFYRPTYVLYSLCFLCDVAYIIGYDDLFFEDTNLRF